MWCQPKKERKKEIKSGYETCLFPYNCLAWVMYTMILDLIKNRREYCSVVGKYQETLKHYRMKRFSYWKILQLSSMAVKHILNSDLHNSFVNACPGLAVDGKYSPLFLSWSLKYGLKTVELVYNFVGNIKEWKLSASPQYLTYLSNK